MWNREILHFQGFQNRIDQYVALGKLGEGTFGTVILAEHKYS